MLAWYQGMSTVQYLSVTVPVLHRCCTGMSCYCTRYQKSTSLCVEFMKSPTQTYFFFTVLVGTCVFTVKGEGRVLRVACVRDVEAVGVPG
jgi:hypothetical protein